MNEFRDIIIVRIVQHTRELESLLKTKGMGTWMANLDQVLTTAATTIQSQAQQITSLQQQLAAAQAPSAFDAATGVDSDSLADAQALATAVGLTLNGTADVAPANTSGSAAPAQSGT